MSDIFAGVYGARFPDVVLNQGPMPGAGGLPAPLHDVPDSRINYNSTLLGDLSPYAYGEPGYQSSQNAYLNIPHRIQKFVPALWLPNEAGTETFQLSHGVDDGDIAFVMRLNRNSIFCTGTQVRNQRNGLGNVIDPLINLATLNYLLAGLQVSGTKHPGQKNLWPELLLSLDPGRFPATARDYRADMAIITDSLGNHSTHPYPEYDPLTLDDLIHVIRHCIRPFGIVRGSEKQGGQSETTMSSVQWPVPAIATLVLDGKEANIVNIWHNHSFNAGDDLVLRLKPMPLQQYTLNHFAKGLQRRRFGADHGVPAAGGLVWQLVPDIYSLELSQTAEDSDFHTDMGNTLRKMYPTGEQFKMFKVPFNKVALGERGVPQAQLKALKWCHLLNSEDPEDTHKIVPWQEMGFWHIGRTQVMMQKYTSSGEFYCNDLANNLSTNHLDMTFQPTFMRHPHIITVMVHGRMFSAPSHGLGLPQKRAAPWEPALRLEMMDLPAAEEPRAAASAAAWPEPALAAPPAHEEPAHEEPAHEEPAPGLAQPDAAQPPAKRGRKPTRHVEGSLLRADGSAEASEVSMLT